MTLQEAIDALEALVDLDLDLNVGDSPTDQQLCDLLSASATRVYQEVQYEYATAAFDPVAGDQVLPMQDDTLNGSPTFGANLFDVKEVRIGGYPITFYPWREFLKVFPTFRDATNDAPYAFTISPELDLVFNCPFSIGCIATGGFGVTGYGAPRRFDASLVASEWSQVHRLLQWPVIRDAVPYGVDAYLDSPQALTRVQMYDQLARADKTRFLELSSRHNSPLSCMPTTLDGGVF